MQRGTNYAPDGGASDFDGRVVSLLNHADRRRVLVIGDVILDRYIGGNVERVSPEAPVPVLVMANDNCYLGGAANAAANVVSLGGSAVLIGRRGGNPGNDIAGTTLEELLHKHKIEAAMIGEIGYQTPEKIRYVAKGAHLLRVDRDYKWEVSAAAQASVMDAVTEVIHRCDAVLISDYDKGLITDDLAQFIVTAAQKHDIPTVIDSKNLANISINGALVVTPNSGELSAIRTELGLPQSASQQRTAIDFMRRAGVQAVLGTYGDQGMALFDCEEGDSGETYFIDAIRQDSDIVDVAGAGDTVAGALALALADGLSLVDGAEFANIAAGIVVGKSGTAQASASEILDYLMMPRTALLGEVDAIAGAVDMVQSVRKRSRGGVIVGVANGCFDLLHEGHLHLLSQAARQCDILIVAVNDDSSVCRQKGAGRPIQSLSTRMAVLAGLGHVHTVVPFADDTPDHLIKAIAPDILFKGGDYLEAEVVGAEWAGEVRIIDLLPGASSTATIEKIKAIA